MTHTEKMLEMCKKAHEHKDELMSKMSDALYDKSISITEYDLLMYMAMKDICEDNVMELQREGVWQPLNDKLRQADGIYTVTVDHDSDFVKAVQSHGKDVGKAVKHAMRMIEGMKSNDPARYNQFMTEI